MKAMRSGSRVNYVSRRLLLLVPVLLGISVIAFVLVRVIPVDPAKIALGETALRREGGQATYEALRKEMGLDEPLYIQYFIYINQLLHLDLGKSFTTSRPVLEDLLRRLPATAELVLFAVAISIIVGIPLGIICATKKDTWLDHIVRLSSLVGVSMPRFWSGLILLTVFWFSLGWAPAPTGRIDGNIVLINITGSFVLDSILSLNIPALASSLHHIILPAICLSTSTLAYVTRMIRSSMLESLTQDYIKTARAKGLSERVVIYKHALRNSIIPTITILGLQIGWLLGGTVVVEYIFSWPGVGRYAVESIGNADYVPIQGFMLMMCLVYVLINLAVDVSYSIFDPRIKY